MKEGFMHYFHVDITVNEFITFMIMLFYNINENAIVLMKSQ